MTSNVLCGTTQRLFSKVHHVFGDQVFIRFMADVTDVNRVSVALCNYNGDMFGYRLMQLVLCPAYVER